MNFDEFKSTNIKPNVWVFVLYSGPHNRTDSGETEREGGHRAEIGLDETSDPIRHPVCQIFAKSTRFFGWNSHCLAVAEWLSGVERSQAIFGSSNIGKG